MTRRGFILEEHIDALTHDDPRTDGFVGPLEVPRHSAESKNLPPQQHLVTVTALPFRWAA